MTNRSDSSRDFAREAGKKSQGSAGSLLAFLRHNRKWWLTPVIVILVLVGGLVILGATAAAPFIYTLF